MPTPLRLSHLWFIGGLRQVRCFASTASVPCLPRRRLARLSSHQPSRFSTALPNLSLNRTRYGMSRKASTCLGLHHQVLALRATPSLSG